MLYSLQGTLLLPSVPQLKPPAGLHRSIAGRALVLLAPGRHPRRVHARGWLRNVQGPFNRFDRDVIGQAVIVRYARTGLKLSRLLGAKTRGYTRSLIAAVKEK